jgi:cytosine/adenosine deaminase-related metal-dependent hydrolase
MAPLVPCSLGLNESLRAGVTTLCDICTATAISDLFCEFDVTAALEVIGFSRARAGSALAAVVERLNALQKSEGGHGIVTGRGLKFGISPHAPYTVSPYLLRELITLANQRELPVAMHLAESAEELEFLQSGSGPFQELLDERSMWDPDAVPRGSRPLDYLRMLAGGPRSLVVHGNYLDGEELAFLASRRQKMSLVYCPRTHAYFKHPPYPLKQAIDAGVRIALGTDSRASNPDLDLLSEMRHVARHHPEIHPQQVLQMGTLAGAQALGRANNVGSITPGKLANIVAIPLPAGADGSASDLLSALLASDEKTQIVWDCRGRWTNVCRAATTGQ